MRRLTVLFLFTSSVLLPSSMEGATAKQQASVVKDAQAIAEVQTALTAMGASALVVQDSVASGTLTATVGKSSVSMPVILKSKGTQMTRVEVQKPAGTSVRIVNHGMGVIEQPDGTMRLLLMNNTLIERVNHVPALSLLGDFQDSAVSVENFGSSIVSNQQTQVVALRPLVVPTISQAEWDKSLSKTTFYIDTVSNTVVKIAFTNFSENDPNLGQQIELYLSNYKAVDGILVPMRQTTYADGQLESDMVLNSVTFNVGLADSDFAIPQAASQ